MKLSEYAKKVGVTYKTAYNWYKTGKIENAYEMPSGMIVVPDTEEKDKKEYGVILYARTSSSNNKKMLEEQAKRLESYAIAKGYKIKQIIKEYGSGLNDQRKLLSKVLKDDKYDKIIVEHKDRLTRFGFNWIQLLTNNRIEVMNESKEKDEDIVNDFISIIHSFSCRLYGLRKSKRLKLKIKKDIKDIDSETER